MNLLDMVRRAHVESMSTGAAPSTLAGANNRTLRIAYAMDEAWRQIGSMSRGWRWARRQGVLAIPAASGDTFSAAALGLSNFLRWRRRDPSLGYRPRTYRLSQPSAVWPLQWVEHDAFRERFQDVAQSAGPIQCWTIDQQERLVVGPAPDEEHRILADYYEAPNQLAADTDEPAMPARHHMAIVWSGLVQIGMSDGAAELVTRAQEHLDEAMDQLIDDQAEELRISYRALA